MPRPRNEGIRLSLTSSLGQVPGSDVPNVRSTTYVSPGATRRSSAGWGPPICRRLRQSPTPVDDLVLGRLLGVAPHADANGKP